MWREDKEEDVGSYWMTFKKREYPRYWKKHYTALCEELALTDYGPVVR
jgi:hypothetical protein